MRGALGQPDAIPTIVEWIGRGRKSGESRVCPISQWQPGNTRKRGSLTRKGRFGGIPGGWPAGGAGTPEPIRTGWTTPSGGGSGVAIRLLACLTPQPIRPKLRLNTQMFLNPKWLRVAAVLLGIIFLAAQFHFCADLNAGPGGSHPCQLCSAAGSAIAAQTLNLSVVPVVYRFEFSVPILASSFVLFRTISPRAPPSL